MARACRPLAIFVSTATDAIDPKGVTRRQRLPGPFEGQRSIQLSYGRLGSLHNPSGLQR